MYHVTHLNNLESILSAGSVLSDAAGASPSVDISTDRAREARRMITVDDDGSAVADFVPFFLSPASSAWGSVRSGSSDPRLSVSASPTEFVVLVTSVKAVTDARTGADVVIADRDAAHPLTHFATATDASNRMLRKLNAEAEQLAIADAEVLVRESVPFEVFSVITVANDRARNAVKELLRGSSFAPRVAIHPPWFSSEVE